MSLSLTRGNYTHEGVITTLLGVCSAFYLGFNLVLRGGVAEIPIVVVSLIALVLLRPAEGAGHKGFKDRISWAFVLLGFALFNCFMIWFHDGEIELYEPYAKLLAGSLAAFALAYHRVNVIYIRAGLYVAAGYLIYLYLFEYRGHGRYSAGMNPNKWSPMLLSYAVASLVLVFFDKSRLFKAMAFLAWFVFAGMIFIATSRTTILVLVLVTLCIPLFMILCRRLLLSLPLLAILILSGFLLFNYSGSPIESRSKQFFREFSASQSDKYTSSSGFRFLMWKGGLISVKDSIFTGLGYDLAKTIEGYEPQSKGEVKAINIIKKRFGSFHNTWIDVFVSQGLLGLSVLLSFFAFSLILVKKNRTLLMLGPLVAIGLNGLTESTMYMSILVGHLALAGAIYMNWNAGDLSEESRA